jgi:hypothetical protein
MNMHVQIKLYDKFYFQGIKAGRGTQSTGLASASASDV